MAKTKEQERKTHRLFIRIRDKSKPIEIRDGNRLIPTKWVEVKAINLGSVKKPNTKIFEIKLQPIAYEKDDVPDFRKIMGRFFPDR